MEKLQGRRSWRSRICGLTACIFAASFLVALVPTIAANAEGIIFKIQGAEITAISDNATGAIASFDDSKIVSEVTFHKLGDSATYKVTLKNTDSKDHTIQSITDNNANSYISYSYDKHANETITAGSNLELIFTAKYETAADLNARAQSSDIKFSIQFTDIDEPEELVITPNTSDSLGASLAILAVSSVVLIICVVVFAKNHKAARKIAAVVIVALAAAFVATGVKAATIEENSFTLVTNYGLRDKVVVRIDGEENVIDYGDTIEDTITDPEKPGYIFNGWTDENGEEVDPTKPVHEDITITPAYSAISYKVRFNANGGTGEMADQSFTYDLAQNLADNTFAYVDYSFTGWDTQANGTGVHYDNKESVSNLATENNAVVDLYAQWAHDPYAVSLVVNNGTGSDTKNVDVGESASFTGITPNVTYHMQSEVSCTNGQAATYENGTVTLGEVTAHTTCTITAVPTIHTITYMQEMTPAICAATTTPDDSLDTADYDDWDGSHHGDINYIPRKVLVDTRDNQKYLVAKLADGECWMTQNLNLVMSTTKTLTKDDSDFQTIDSYTPDRNTETSLPTSGSPYGDFATVSDIQLSWHPRNKYYVSNENYPSIGVVGSAAPTSDSDEYLWQKAGIFYSGLVLSAGTYHYNGGSGVHYSDTICPKGWTLPEGKARGGAESDPREKSFDKLYSTYVPSRDYMEIANFNQTSIFRLVYPGYLRTFTSAGLNYETWATYFASNYIADYNGQSNRNSITKAFYSTRDSAINSYIAGHAAYGLSARCIAR